MSESPRLIEAIEQNQRSRVGQQAAGLVLARRLVPVITCHSDAP
jgi:hypothetical protein